MFCELLCQRFVSLVESFEVPEQVQTCIVGVGVGMSGLGMSTAR